MGFVAIVGSAFDHSAVEFAARWRSHGARLIDVDDLSTRGWSVRPGCSHGSTAVLDGSVVPCDEIVGVITTRPAVLEQELRNVVPADRIYVAGEMSAFLLAWLSGLSCPVINPPTATCLCGPAWPIERWLNVASSLRIPINPAFLLAKLHGTGPDSVPQCATSVLDDAASVDADECLLVYTGALARAAGTAFLTATFDSNQPDGRLLYANCVPDLSSPAITALLASYFFSEGKPPAADPLS